MNKKLFLVLLILFGLLYLNNAHNANAQTMADGDLISAENSPDIYIVKIVGNKNFRRLILNPTIFESYGHLSWDDVKTVSQSTIDNYKNSNLAIEVNKDGSVADPKIYAITSSAGSDVGERRWLNIEATEFESAGLDWDSIYHINHTEASPGFYPIKTALSSSNSLIYWATSSAVNTTSEEDSQSQSEPEPAPTIKSGVISKDFVWNSENSPYLVSENILVDENTTLTIESGVVVTFEKDSFIQIMGDLHVIGDKNSPVIFDSNTNDKWYGFKVGKSGEYNKGGNIRLQHCKVDNAFYAVSIEAQANEDFNNFFIEDCEFTNNQNAIQATRPGPQSYVKNSLFTNSSIYVYWDFPNDFIAQYNTFKNSTVKIGSDHPHEDEIIKFNFNNLYESKLEVELYKDIDATNNYWGTTNTSEIENSIFDYYDDFSLGEVNYQPIATSEILDAGVQ